MDIDWSAVGVVVALVVNISAITAAFVALRHQAKSNRDSIDGLKMEVAALRGKISNGMGDRLVRVETKLDNFRGWVADIDNQLKRLTNNQ